MKNPAYKFSRQDINLLRAGNEAAFEALFMAYQPRLFRFIWLRLHSIEAAEDLVQETFFRLWKTRDRLKPYKNLEIYLFRIASNLTIDYMRKVRRKPLVLEAPDTLSSASTPETTFFANQTSELITRTTMKLPERQRDAFVLSRFEGFSHAQIAKIMGISTKTVEKHIGSALKTLRRELQSSGII